MYDRQKLIEVSVPKRTLKRYAELIIAKSVLIVNSNALFYIKEEHVSAFTALKNTKKTR